MATKGDQFHALVTVEKVKKNQQTVIRVEGKKYILVHEDTMK